MSQNTTNPYFRTQIMTAGPEQLRLLLYEGAIKFCRQAKDSLEKLDFEASYNSITRAEKIVLELSTSLNEQVDPELCKKLNSLYTYVYRLLVDTNINHKIEPLDEAIGLLEYEKKTWQLLMERLIEEGKGTRSEDAADISGAQQTAISSLSKQA